MMFYGKLWSEEETKILKENSEQPNEIIQSALKASGFERSIGSIDKKWKRLWKNKQLYSVVTEEPTVKVVEPCLTKESKTINYVKGSLPLNEKAPYTKFVMLNDVHIPHNIPLGNVFQFIYEYGPDYVLLVGDIINNDPFSHWDKQSPMRFKNMPQPKPYYNQCNELFYNPLRTIVGKDCKIVHWIGNHEFWSNKAILEMPEGEGYWEVENNINGIDSWVESRGIASLGKLHFIHGDILKASAGCSRKIVQTFHRSVRFGHFHSIEESSQSNPVDAEDRHTARCCGTLQKFNPNFMFNQPHAWQHAFTYGTVFPDGTFSDHTTTIVNDRFVANGKIYG